MCAQSRKDWTATDRGFGGAPLDKPLPAREIEIAPRNFSFSLEEKIRAYAGVPAFVRRARRLEDLMDKFWSEAEKAYTRIKDRSHTRAEFSRRWKEAVEELEYAEIEHVVKEYNEKFPIEANLPFDPLTHDYVFRGAPFKRAVAPGSETVLERFPADRGY